MKYNFNPQSNEIFLVPKSPYSEDEEVAVSGTRKTDFHRETLPPNRILATSDGKVIFVMTDRTIILQSDSGAREWLADHPFFIWPTKQKFGGASVVDMIPGYDGLDMLFKLAWIG